MKQVGVVHDSKNNKKCYIPTVLFRYGTLNTVGIYCVTVIDYSNLFQYFLSMCYGPYSTVQLKGNVASIHMRVMLTSSRGIILLQCTVQYLWNIAWICTSHARHLPHMRTLTTEFSNFIQHLNHINICDQSHNYVRASL